MGRSHSVWLRAMLLLMCLGVSAPPRAAQAQQSEAFLRALDYLPDPLARSPRLIAMGQLLLVEDVHNRLSLWDFAGNPTGIADAESVSTVEYRPVFRSSSVLADQVGGERQELAARETRHQIETWRRTPGSPAYGLVADIATLQVDRPFAQAVEQRGKFTVPSLAGAVNGKLPWIHSTRFGFAVRGQFGREIENDGFLEFFRLPQGDYLGRKSAIVPPPDLFTPDRYETTKMSGGIALSMNVTRDIKAAVGYDRGLNKVRATLDGTRSTSKVDEDRPYHLGQASVIGRLSPNLAWGADGRAWTSQSEQFYFWSVSAGPTSAPLSGSGKRLDRDVRGTSLRTQVRWTSGALELGAGFGTSFRREIVTPWYPTVPGDKASFNEFLKEVGTRAGADTLLLPAAVTASQVEERTVDILGGGNWQLPDRRGVVGIEFERSRVHNDLATLGGPRPVRWDLRAGGEYRCNDAFLARAGWSYGIHDRDELTADDSFRSTVASVGFGVRPAAARWSADIAYAYEWVRADYADPTQPRGAHQRLAAQMRWPF